jgi:hypothetical protein
MRPSQTLVDRKALVARSAATIARSLERNRSSEDRVERSLRRSLRPLRGGADDTNDASMERERMMQFISRFPPNEVPRIYAGRSTGGKKCDVCGRDIMPGASEYEIEFHAVMFRLDRKCLALWQTEAAKS